jgi:hypothetical protein
VSGKTQGWVESDHLHGPFVESEILHEEWQIAYNEESKASNRLVEGEDGDKDGNAKKTSSATRVLKLSAADKKIMWQDVVVKRANHYKKAKCLEDERHSPARAVTPHKMKILKNEKPKKQPATSTMQDSKQA